MIICNQHFFGVDDVLGALYRQVTSNHGVACRNSYRELVGTHYERTTRYVKSECCVQVARKGNRARARLRQGTVGLRKRPGTLCTCKGQSPASDIETVVGVHIACNYCRPNDGRISRSTGNRELRDVAAVLHCQVEGRCSYRESCVLVFASRFREAKTNTTHIENVCCCQCQGRATAEYENSISVSSHFGFLPLSLCPVWSVLTREPNRNLLESVGIFGI